MAVNEPLNCLIGFDDREPICSDVAASSIRRRTDSNVNIKYLKHRELRANGWFKRPWQMDADTGEYRDLIDSKNFSTQFSHTRFLVPALQQFKGWALFMDADMIFLSDIKHLFALCDDRFAVMCVKHNHHPVQNAVKMDGRLQQTYFRKNWSSFVLWNCSHPANIGMTKEHVNYSKGSDLHAFSWLADSEIGSIPFRYNYISGISPLLNDNDRPAVIHYTEGGPWFSENQDVPYADLWLKEYHEWQRDAGNEAISPIPSTQYDLADKVKRRP